MFVSLIFFFSMTWSLSLVSSRTAKLPLSDAAHTGSVAFKMSSNVSYYFGACCWTGYGEYFITNSHLSPPLWVICCDESPPASRKSCRYRYSCDQLEPPMDSHTERLTAVRIHKQGNWLRLGFISRVIDCCWHKSCQRRKWWLTNDRVESAAREITSALLFLSLSKPPGNHATSPRLSQCLFYFFIFFTATLDQCQTDNAATTSRQNTFAPHTEEPT